MAITVGPYRIGLTEDGRLAIGLAIGFGVYSALAIAIGIFSAELFGWRAALPHLPDPSGQIQWIKPEPAGPWDWWWTGLVITLGAVIAILTSALLLSWFVDVDRIEGEEVSE
jgi:hypothetical protein